MEDGNIADLIKNQYMNEYVKHRQDLDRETFLDDRLRNRK